MDHPLCSVIIPTYNHGKYIERSVRCALDQTYPNVEIIVVDDGSTDNTQQVVQGFGDRIQYIYKENAGLGAARNTGIEASSGKYLQFLDADDTIDARKLEIHCSVLEELDDIAIVYSDCTGTDFHGNNYETVSYPLDPSENIIEVLLRHTLSGVHAHLVRRSAVIDAGMFDVSRFAQEDWELWLKMAIEGCKFKYVPGNLAHYDQTGSEMTSNPELMYKRTKHLLYKFLIDPQFRALGPEIVNKFVWDQNLALARRAYNNRWWKLSRQHYINAVLAVPKVRVSQFFTYMTKTVLHQSIDAVTRRSATAPQELDM